MFLFECPFARYAGNFAELALDESRGPLFQNLSLISKWRSTGNFAPGLECLNHLRPHFAVHTDLQEGKLQEQLRMAWLNLAKNRF